MMGLPQGWGTVVLWQSLLEQEDGWGRVQLQERQNAGILLFTPKFRANTVQKLLGWAEHS